MLIFEHSRPGRRNYSQAPTIAAEVKNIPAKMLRKIPPLLPEVSEMDTVRHFTRLSQLNFSIDTHFYPLGSCTMKYNPKINEDTCRLPGFLYTHPLQPIETVQGNLVLMFDLLMRLALFYVGCLVAGVFVVSESLRPSRRRRPWRRLV